MGGQTWQPKQTAEEIARQREEEAQERAAYRASQLYGLVNNVGNSSGRIINWQTMPARR